MLNDCVTEAPLYVLLYACPAGAVAVILHRPAPVVVPLAVPVVVATVHGPDAEKLTSSPDVDDALTENALPYCTLGNAPKVMVCDCVVEPLGRIIKLPDAGVAAL
jgi:hypothetical protein